MSVAANAVRLSTLRICADLLSFALFAFIARTYGREGSGEFSYAYAIAGLALLIATSGFEEYGVRQFARTSIRSQLDHWREMLTAQVVRLLLGFVLLGLFLLADGGQHARPAVVLELALFLMGWGVSRTFYVPATASQEMKTPATVDLLCRGSAILLALVAGLLAAPDMPILLISFPVCSFVLVWLSARNAASYHVPFDMSLSPAKVFGLLRATAPFGGSELLNQFYARADVLLIANMLGAVSVGLYATDIKFIEVGLVPLNLLGIAAYPVLSHRAAQDDAVFRRLSQQFIRIILFLSGWLAVGIACLVPLLIVPLFGEGFRAGVELLPWVAALALLKGAENALYRVLYANDRQMRYLLSLAIGTVLIVALNFALIPAMYMRGAVIAGVISTLGVVLICMTGLRNVLSVRFVLSTCARLGVSLAATAAVFAGLGSFGLGPWVAAILACVAFPLLAYVTRLVPPIPSIELFARHDTASGESAGIPEGRIGGAGPDL